MAKFITSLNHAPLLALAERLRTQPPRIVENRLEQIKTDIETAMQLPKSGTVYGDHQASAPGDAPAVLEGDLINSLVVEMTGPAAGELRAEDPKAGMLEFGTLNEDGTQRMAPRPFMIPGAEANRQPFIDDVEGMLRGR